MNYGNTFQLTIAIEQTSLILYDINDDRIFLFACQIDQGGMEVFCWEFFVESFLLRVLCVCMYVPSIPVYWLLLTAWTSRGIFVGKSLEVAYYCLLPLDEREWLN